MKRKLGKFERAATITDEGYPWNLVSILLLDGIPSLEMVRQSLDILQKRHPFLRVRIDKQGSQYYFVDDEVSSIPLELVEHQNDDFWIEVAEGELNQRVNSKGGPLLKCTYLQNVGARGGIIFTFHHSIADGSSIIRLIDEMMELCAALHSGEEINGFGEPLSPLAPVEDQFPPAFQGLGLKWKTMLYMIRSLGDEFSYRMRTMGKRKPPINVDARVRIIPMRIPEDMTRALVKRSRKERVTLNSVLNAAMLLVVHKHLYNREDTALRYMSMADLRPYVKPAETQGELGCYISALRFTTGVHSDTDLWFLAGAINKQIYEAFKRGDKFIASVVTEQLIRLTFSLKSFRMSTTALSYTGKANIKPSYGPFKVVNLHGFVSNFGLGPEYAAQVGLFNDELLWDILYVDTDLKYEEALRIADEIGEILKEAGGG